MNVAVLHFHRLGGSGIIAYEIARALCVKKKFNIHFIGLAPPFRMKYNSSDPASEPDFFSCFRFHPVAVPHYSVFDFQPYLLALAAKLSQVILSQKIDVIHSHYAIPHSAAALLGREIARSKASNAKHIGCVTTLHGTDITVVGSHPSMKPMTKYLIESCEVVTAVSNSLARTAEEFFEISEGKIETVYNFINPASYPKTFAESLTAKKALAKANYRVILHYSSLRPVKAPLDVIEIFARLHRAGIGSFKLWIVGDGPMRVQMIERAQELGVEREVVFYGAHADLSPMLRKASLFLLPSLKEAFGLSALEAMGFGVPVLASRTGGLPEVISEGTDGLLFEAGNLAAAATLAIRLLSDEKEYERIAKNAFNTARQKFNFEDIIEKYAALYHQAIHLAKS